MRDFKSHKKTGTLETNANTDTMQMGDTRGGGWVKLIERKYLS